MCIQNFALINQQAFKSLFVAYLCKLETLHRFISLAARRLAQSILLSVDTFSV